MPGGKPRSAPDLVLRERIFRHLEWCGKELSAFELARALCVPGPPMTGRDRVARELAVLAAQGFVVAVQGELPGRYPVTRWGLA